MCGVPSRPQVLYTGLAVSATEILATATCRLWGICRCDGLNVAMSERQVPCVESPINQDVCADSIAIACCEIGSEGISGAEPDSRGRK